MWSPGLPCVVHRRDQGATPLTESQHTPTLDSIDDPHGIPLMLFDELVDGTEAGQQFIEGVQAIRWELWNLLGSLDNVEAPARATQWAVMHAIDVLGMSTRAEAAALDGFDADPADLFTDGSIRRLERNDAADREAKERRQNIRAAPEPDSPDR